MVVWELLTLEIPYRDFEQSTIIYGVGNSKLSLPLPRTFPKGYKLLMEMCWKTKPRNRPSFQQILTHLDIASREFNDFKLDQFQERQVAWKTEVRRKLSQARISFNTQHSLSSSASCQNLQALAGSPRKTGSQTPDPNQVQQYEHMLRKTASLYTDMVEVIESLKERERRLRKSEKARRSRSRNDDDNGDDLENEKPEVENEEEEDAKLTKRLLQKVLNDPIYQSALELSRETGGSERDVNVVSIG